MPDLSFKKILLCTFGSAMYVLLASAVLLADVNTVSAINDANLGATVRDKLKSQTLYNLQEVVARQLMPYISREDGEILFIYDEWPKEKAYLQGIDMTAEEAEYLNGVPHDRRVVVLSEGEGQNEQ